MWNVNVIIQLLTDLDYRAFKILNSFVGISGFWDAVFVALSEYVIFILIAGLALFIFFAREKKSEKRGRAVIEALAAAFIARTVIASLIRVFFFRARPFVIAAVHQLVTHSPLESSFPSGHASFMFALAFAVFAKNRKWGAVYFILATISGFSRVVVGVHFPLDIIGGAAVGALAFFIARRTSPLFDAFVTSRKRIKV